MRTDAAIRGLEGVSKIVDDVFIWASDSEQLKQRIAAVLDRCREFKITLSLSKAQVGLSVRFAGFVVSEDGVKVNDDRIRGIQEFPTPTNRTDLRSFFGLANQFGKFLPDLAHVMSPLRPLLKQDCKFEWSKVEDKTFMAIKEILCS